MKKGCIFIMFLLLLPAIHALEVTKSDKGSVVISELGNPAVYEFAIRSPVPDTLEIYSLVGIDFSPRGTFDVSSGTTKLEVSVYPSKTFKDRPGNYVVEYFIKGNQGMFRDTLEFKVVSLANTIALIPENLHPDDEMLEVQVKNIQNTLLTDVTITFSSEFGMNQKILSLQPYEGVNVSLPIDKEKSSRLRAGTYILTGEIALGEAEAKTEGVITYLEKQGTSLTKTSEGLFIRKTSITKKNEGNVPVVDSIEVQKDIVSRLFTSYSLEPEKTERSGLIVRHTWSKQLQPAESWVLLIKTNYTLPFILIILIVVVAFLVHVYTMTHVRVEKRVSYVKTKGGELALKVRLSVKARRHVDRIQLIDRLPGMTQLYEKFGIKPDRIDASTRRLFWNIQSLQAGEERVFSYIVYSKINIVGTFELPAATALYEVDGKMHEVLSNRAFFVADTAQGE
ncbi:hypothetical protein HYZ97_01180 [Candidatus Pacearchaeota archaeon]|nr:hypothetical protein [Candidatus Pacearchaeota archaeon]